MSSNINMSSKLAKTAPITPNKHKIITKQPELATELNTRVYHAGAYIEFVELLIKATRSIYG